MSDSTAQISEDDRQFYELDRHRQQARQRLYQLKSNSQMKQKIKRRSELCKAEIDILPNETKTYKAVGRMFLISPINEIKSELDKLISGAANDLSNYSSQEKQLTAELEQSEKNIQELVGKLPKAQ
jgi:prefoldin subunit 1